VFVRAGILDISRVRSTTAAREIARDPGGGGYMQSKTVFRFSRGSKIGKSRPTSSIPSIDTATSAQQDTGCLRAASCSPLLRTPWMGRGLKLWLTVAMAVWCTMFQACKRVQLSTPKHILLLHADILNVITGRNERGRTPTICLLATPFWRFFPSLQPRCNV